MTKKYKLFLIFIIALMISSCDSHEATFSEPQPQSINKLSKIFRGSFTWRVYAIFSYRLN